MGEALATAADISACFRLLLGRAPSPEEWAGHGALAGQPLAAVVKSYLDSPEHARRVHGEASPEGRLRLVQADGFVIYADPDDLAVGAHVAAGAYEPEVAAVFRAHLRPGMRVVDVGGNIGVFTMLAASLVGPGGEVLAIEPNLANVRMIEASRRANGFAQVTVAACAVGRRVGLLELRTAFSNGATSEVGDTLAALFAARLAPSLPLARLLPPGRVDFIKIDAEGAEHTALSGALELLRRDRPTIVSEFSPSLLQSNSGVPGEEYLRLLMGIGYDVAVIGPQGRPAPCADPAAAMAHWEASGGDHVDLLLTAAPRGWRAFRRRVG